MPRPGIIILVGLAVFAAALAAELTAEPRGWVRVTAFSAWCVAAFGIGMSYRDYVQRARQRRAGKK